MRWDCSNSRRSRLIAPGLVLEFNAAAEQMFGDDVRLRNRCLELSDRQARLNFDVFIQRLRTAAEGAALSVAPIVVRRSSKRPLLLRVLPVDGAARSPFLGARALLVFSDLDSEAGLCVKLLSQVFGLSPAEGRLAAALADGLSPDQAARKLGIARATARSQLKSVFSKTETHRQSELVAVLSRLS